MASCCKAGVQAPPTEADDDAGIAGLPFMQTEHEDEHEEWIDWAARRAAGGRRRRLERMRRRMEACGGGEVHGGGAREHEE